jgi:hypothetical protein
MTSLTTSITKFVPNEQLANGRFPLHEAARNLNHFLSLPNSRFARPKSYCNARSEFRAHEVGRLVAARTTFSLPFVTESAAKEAALENWTSLPLGLMAGGLSYDTLQLCYDPISAKRSAPTN